MGAPNTIEKPKVVWTLKKETLEIYTEQELVGDVAIADEAKSARLVIYLILGPFWDYYGTIMGTIMEPFGDT